MDTSFLCRRCDRVHETLEARYAGDEGLLAFYQKKLPQRAWAGRLDCTEREYVMRVSAWRRALARRASGAFIAGHRGPKKAKMADKGGCGLLRPCPCGRVGRRTTGNGIAGRPTVARCAGGSTSRERRLERRAHTPTGVGGGSGSGRRCRLFPLMGTEIISRQTPEEQELARKQAELTSLEAELAQSELDLATLRGELHAFEAHYVRSVGARYAELDEIRAQIAEALARVAQEDRSAQERAAQARAEASESAQATGAAHEAAQAGRFQPSENLKKLYREVARRVHPDLANDERDRARRTRLMAEANRAYEEGDEARLQAVLQEWESSPDAVTGEGVGAQLVRVIRKIAQAEVRRHNIGDEIDQLKGSELYQLKIKVDEAEEAGRDLLAEMTGTLDKQIAEAREELAAVTK